MHTQTRETEFSHTVEQAFRLLQFTFVLVPLLAGLDKVVDWIWGFHVLGDWTRYLAPAFPNALGVEPHTFMHGVAIIEIVAALVVAVAPRFGGYLVAAWLWGIILNLLILGQFLDIALRDFGLSLGAIALALMAQARAQHTRVPETEPVEADRVAVTERRAA